MVLQMDKLKTYFFYLCFCFAFFSCSNPENKNNYKHTFADSIVISDSMQLVISSKGKPVNFKLNINDRFPITKEQMLKKIDEIAHDENIPKEQAACEFVSRNTFHSKPLTEKQWQNNPGLFINSVGGGLCESRAALLADLWSTMNFDSRLVNLVNYHVVAEVYAGGKWKMFDADNYIFYHNEKNEIASFDELRNNPVLVSEPLAKYDFGNQYTEHSSWTEKLAEIYRSAVVDTISIEPDEEFNFEITLPANTSLTFHSANSKSISSVTIELRPESKGLLNLPLVPYLAVGGFSFRENDSLYSVKTNDTLWFTTSRFVKNIHIVDVDKSARIMYLVNPRLNILNGKNQVRIESSEELELNTTEYIENVVPNLFASDVAMERLELDSVLGAVYLDFIVNSETYKSGNINNYLQAEFERFLSCDNSLSQNDREELEKKFPMQVQSYLSELNLSNEQFIRVTNSYHPVSLYYLYSGIRYNKPDFFPELWRESMNEFTPSSK